mmetsp:Transcript_12078/g.28006  ORF Transcript_12078/g.28006 Transcript_12078/m.28006 type:complete len:245 (-) Transcript_12078:324-1058(-)
MSPSATKTPYVDIEDGKITMPADFVSDCPPEIRAGFLRKVYSILSFQLLVTAAGAATFMFHEPTRHFVLTNGVMFYAAIFAPFVFLLALSSFRNSHPTNIVLLGAFTFSQTYTVGVVCALYYQSGLGLIVLQALLLTAAVFASLTSYLLITKKDFSWLGGGLSAVLIILLFWGMLNTFFGFGAGPRLIFSLIGAILFAGYIVYDTSLILHHLGPDDYIEATISLYLDIVNLFFYLLQILRGGDS